MSQTAPRVEFITERARLAAGREQTVDVLLRITAPELETVAGHRPRLNLSVVLDRSGSMDGVKMERAREAARYCIDQLLPQDRLSVVIFDDEIEVLIPSQPVENKTVLKESLRRIRARNSTALHEAWVRGGMQVSEHLSQEGINRVLLITDGLANVGITNTDEIVSQAGGLFKRGVSTSTIGIGGDFNEDLLMPMAEAGGGNAWHVQEPEDMQRIFAVELEGLIAQVAHTITLGLVPADGVRLVDVLNDFELGETGRYKLPNLQAGSPLEVVVQLKIPAQPSRTKLRLLDLRLGYTPQDAKAAEVVKQAFEVEFDEESAIEHLPLRAEVGKAVQLLMNARARREAMAHMDRGDFASARGVVAASMSASAPLFARMRHDQDVSDEETSLSELSELLEDPSRGKDSRKRLAYDSYLRRLSRKLR
ncbi:MAG TPA: VWA domain-containing protein [Pyrinomonadaceae bacterium]|jgi:Ca-activated chloride channel family protein